MVKLLIKPHIDRELKLARSSGELEKALPNNDSYDLRAFLHDIFGEKSIPSNKARPVSSYEISEIKYAFHMLKKFSASLPSFYDEASRYGVEDFDQIETSVIKSLSDGNIHAPRILIYLVGALKKYHACLAECHDPTTPFIFKGQRNLDSQL